MTKDVNIEPFLNSPMEQKENYKMSYEVLNSSLHVSSVKDGAKDSAEKKTHKLGVTHRYVRSHAGRTLYWGDKAYVVDAYGKVEKIHLPEQFKGSLLEYDVIESAFIHNDMFVLYKGPQSRNDNGQCFFYDMVNNITLLVSGNKDFHNALIGNIQNVYMHCNDIVKGYVIIDIEHSLQKFTLQNIKSEKADNFSALIAKLEVLPQGKVAITHAGRMVHSSKNDQVHMQGVTGRYIYKYSDRVVAVTDTEHDVTYTCLLTTNIKIQQILVDESGNISVLGYEDQDSHCILLTALRAELYQDLKRYVLPYTTIRAAAVGHNTTWYNELVYVAKKHNAPWELAVMRIQPEGYEVFATPLAASDIEETMFVSYDKGAYKLTSLSASMNPLIIKSQQFVINKDAQQIRAHNKRLEIKQKHLEYYEKEVLDKGGVTYEEMLQQYESMENFVEVMKIFLNQFSIENKKNVLGKEKEHMAFDREKTMSLCKNIIAHPLYKKMAESSEGK